MNEKKGERINKRGVETRKDRDGMSKKEEKVRQ